MSRTRLFTESLARAASSANKAVEVSALRTAARTGQATNSQLMIEAAKMQAELAEHRGAATFLKNVRPLLTADTQNQTGNTAGMFSGNNRPGFSSVERTGVHQTGQQAQNSTPSVSPTT